MKKEFEPAALARIADLKLSAGTDAVSRSENTYRMHQQMPGLLNSGAIVTPFRELPLNNIANRRLKRVVDIAASLLFITLIFPWLFPLIAILIKIDSRGPVFFLQKRNKRNGETFTCIKFRSMYRNTVADILPAAKNDRRITRIGRLLRNSYLDELPQFFNVLWGDMSLIGPRPHMVSDNLKFDELIKNYAFRHRVKPGITGLAQVMGYLGPTETLEEMSERVNLDIFYARHWSARLDLIIFYRTILKTLGTK